MRHEDLDTVLADLGNERPLDSFDWVLGSALNVSIRGDSQCLSLRLRFGEGEPPRLRDSWDYGDVELWEGLLSIKDTVAFLRTPAEKPLQVGRAVVRRSFNIWQGQSPSDHWPVYLGFAPCFLATGSLLVATREDTGEVENLLNEVVKTAPVASADGPCYVNLLAALRDWSGLRETPMQLDSRFPPLQVLVPLLPGQVRNVRSGRDGRLLVELQPGAATDSLRVRLAWEEGREVRTADGVPTPEGFIFELTPFGTFTLYVFRGASLLSHFRVNGQWIEREPNTESDLLRQIRNGETETHEFKEAPRFPAHGWDWAGVLKDVTAFANTEGGTLFFGVTDEAEIVGLSELLTTLPEDDPSGRRKRLEALLRKRAQDSLTRSPLIDISWHDLESKPVMVIRVSANPRGTVTAFKGDAYVRRGSSSRRAEPDEWPELLGGMFSARFRT